VPKLAVVLVGDDPASKIYVRNKIRACEEVGIESVVIRLPADISQDGLHEHLDELNLDTAVDGVLLQLPLPGDLRPVDAIERLGPEKDIDGFHSQNLGQLMAWRSVIEPCTPRGIMTMLRAFEVDVSGKRAVVVGRSMNVGRPMAQMLVRANATVTICHRCTRDIVGPIGEADIVVVATGVPGLVRGSWLREGAIAVDVGISRVANKIVGDIEFSSAIERVSLMTPVPGGVGPMTVATLMENTLRLACHRRKLRYAGGKIHSMDVEA
jgi:methylenetetrahydrofolate dehydrogenase (NADP+)/methenyltetrahydrofolate cyclohydrolase